MWRGMTMRYNFANAQNRVPGRINLDWMAKTKIFQDERTQYNHSSGSCLCMLVLLDLLDLLGNS